MTENLQPNATEIEGSVLGAILSSPGIADQVIPMLPPMAFYDDKHEQIYKAITEMHKLNQPIDILTLSKFLNEKKILQALGGAYFISTLTNKVLNEENTLFHAQVILDKYAQREIIRICQVAISRSLDTYEVGAAYQSLKNGIDEVDGMLNKQSKNVSFSALVDKSVDQYREREAKRLAGGDIGIPTGLTDLDNEIGGYQDGKLIIIGARPSMGKTAFILHGAKAAALRKYRPAIFSLETEDVKLVDRMIIAESDVNAYHYRFGTMSEAEMRAVLAAQDKLRTLDIDIDDSSSSSVSRIRSKCRVLKKKNLLDIVYVDYLQLVESEGGQNREQEVAKISRGLKKLARELKVPVVLLVQLSRETEKRNDKKPHLTDMRESGAIEQDADVVMFPWRPSYYDPNAMIEGTDVSWEGKGAMVIAKNKEGQCGDVKFHHNKNLTKFYDYNHGKIEVNEDPF
jgi:replicative DNA helicase